MTEQGYSGTKAATIVGITYRQLDYWARTDLIRPSLADASGSGSRRLYSYRDLLELRVIKSLLDAGIKLESVRTAFEYLRTHVDTDIASAHLVISGSDVILCDGEQLIDVMRRGGQGVLNVLAIGGVKSGLDSTIVELAGASQRPRPRLGTPCDERFRTQPARCRASAARRQDGSVRWLGDAAVVPDRHDRRAPVVPQRLRRVRRLASRHRAGRGRRRRRATAARVHQRPVDKIAPGRAQYTHLLDEADASVLDDIIVWWVDDDVFDVMPNASNTDRVRAAIGGTETTHDRAILAVQGPRAKERLATVFPDAAAVGRFRVSTLSWEGTTCVVAGTGYTGEAGVEIAVPNAAATDLWAAITGAGVTPAGLGARDTLAARSRPAAARPRARRGHHPPASRAWAGWWPGRKPEFRGRKALDAERTAVSTAC